MTPVSESVSLAGVVLAGGASLRLGRDKATVAVPANVVGPEASSKAPTTAVEHVVSVVGQRCQPIFVVAAPGQALPALQATVLRDDVRSLGELIALGIGLRAAAESGAKRAFVCGVDEVFVTADLIDMLEGRATELDADVVMPWDGRDHYFAALYKTELATTVDALLAAGERTINALADRVDAQRIVLSESPLANLR
jgi:molybdenum cofactor guanylyltransferase